MCIGGDPEVLIAYTLSRGLPSSFIHVAVAAGQDPGRAETIKNKNILIAVFTGQNSLNTLYWFEERKEHYRQQVACFHHETKRRVFDFSFSAKIVLYVRDFVVLLKF